LKFNQEITTENSRGDDTGLLSTLGV